LVKDLGQRVAASGAAGLVIVLGIVAWVVAVSSDSLGSSGLSPAEAALLFSLPATALFSLWVPGSVRAVAPKPVVPQWAAGQPAYGQAPPQGYGQAPPPGYGAPQQGYGAPQQWQPPAPPPPPPGQTGQ